MDEGQEKIFRSQKSEAEAEIIKPESVTKTRAVDPLFTWTQTELVFVYQHYLGWKEVCLILDTKSKNYGFILAPRRPCHARLTFNTKERYSHTGRPGDLKERIAPFILAVSTSAKVSVNLDYPTDRHNYYRLHLKNTRYFFNSWNPLLFWGSQSIFSLKKRFKPMFLCWWF